MQNSLSKLQETIVLRVLRVPHVLLCSSSARSTLPHTVTCFAIAWRKAQKWLHPVSSGAPRSSKDSVVKDQCYPEGFGADSWSRSNFTPRRNHMPPHIQSAKTGKRQYFFLRLFAECSFHPLFMGLKNIF